LTGERGFDARQLHAAAQRFAQAHQIDLPSAYSVLLGIATVDQIRSGDPVPTAPARGVQAGAAESPGGSRKPTYDAGFRQAVAEGRLTVQQAIERGNRNVYASRLAKRHKLPMRLAYEVADNKLTLREAVGRNEPTGGEGAPKPARTAAAPDTAPRATMTARQRAVAVMLALLVLGGVAGYAWMLWQDQARRSLQIAARATEVSAAVPAANDGERSGTVEEQPTVPASATASQGDGPAGATPGVEVVKDAQGQVTRVIGPDPSAVLEEYCKARGVEPVTVAASTPPLFGVRIGVFRDIEHLESYFSIRIRRDSRTRRWVVGDGDAPIRPVAVEPTTPGTTAAL
jgi:hypothetical protein